MGKDDEERAGSCPPAARGVAEEGLENSLLG